MVLGLQYKSALLKLKKTWFFVGLASLSWIVAVFSFQDILRLILPYLFPILGIVAILMFAVWGIKVTIQPRQRRKFQEAFPSLSSIEVKKRKPPPNINFCQEQKCSQCYVGTLRLVSEVFETPPTPDSLGRYWVRRRICQICGYSLTEYELPGGWRYFRDSEGNVWRSLY